MTRMDALFRAWRQRGARLLAALSITLLAGCGSYPRDMNGTLDAIRSGHELKVGIVTDAALPENHALTQSFLNKVSSETHANLITSQGSSERLFAQLDAGEIDLVMGEVAVDTPWIAEVTVIEPLAERTRSGRQFGLSAIVRNGENAWMMFLERTQRDLLAKS